MQTNQPTTEKRPLLTFAIPTYNRSGFLRQLLDSVSEQVQADTRVELLISDNASTDGTSALVEGVVRTGVSITYIRNETNIGPDANFLQCYERASGKYVWVMGDDDIVAQGAIGRIAGYLAEDEYDLIYLNPFGFQGQEVDPKSYDVAKPRAQAFSKPAPFVRRIHVFFAMISANIVNKDRVDSLEHKPFATLIGSNLIHLGWLFTALRGHRKSLYIDERLFGYRVDNTGGFGVCEVFGRKLSRLAAEWLQKPDLTKLILNGATQRFLPTHLFRARLGNDDRFPREDAHLILSGIFGRSIRYWIFDYPVIVLPAGLGWCWLQILRVINRVDRACGYPSLSW
jgi:abequosyltransferase